MGGVIGGLIPFIMNYNREDAVFVNDGTYIGFMVFMTIGTVLALSILHPSKVIRNDGSCCTNIKYSNVFMEAVEIGKLFTNWKMLLIVPAAWMIGSVVIGHIMDFSFKSRRTRGLAGIGVVAVLGTGIWVGGLFNQRGYDYDDVQEKTVKVLDFKNSGSDFAGPFVLYFSYGLLDAMFQSMVYWIIGGLADDSAILSRYVGFYKGIQSAGAAVAWQIDTHKVSYMNQLIVNWVLTTASYPLLVLLVIKAIKDEDEDEVAVAVEVAEDESQPQTDKILMVD